MDITLKLAQLAEFNLSIKTLGNNIEDVLKTIKRNRPTIYEESTRASTDFNDFFHYVPRC